ncbi:rhomboid family intramembrane serine protease [Litoreibacter roseus]|uniref:Rhomboid family intramembrane serine protease n=1 Tax=Litoreibacter roseus TaxID=2601869 RepID=A0A6N6JAP7_9RHOB|nr:rhomboid family intramembrane serine protease [Litoreibacter roseus]GFE63311.1 rhomboid family intramembrane serine protease [Litoreibacter roseus]
MYDPNANVSPFNALPPAVVGLAMIMGAVELVLQIGALGFAGAGGIGWRIAAIQDYAFLGPVWTQMLELGLFPPEHMMRFVTFPFIHGSLLHAAFGVVIVLAIGKSVGEVFSSWSFLAVFFLSSIFGALVYAALTDTNAALFGAYPGGYGLIGAFTFLLWTRLAAVGENTMRAFTLIGFLLGIQLVFGVLFGSGLDWIADVAGFAAGFGLSFLVSPGGWARVLSKLRQR